MDKQRYRQYLREYRDHSFSGNSSHIERNHLIAEAAVRLIMWRSGVPGNGWNGCPVTVPMPCKHMAAVLYALEGRSAQQQMGCRLEWQVALEKLSEEQMRTLLRSMAEGDGSLQDRIVRLVAGPGTEPSHGAGWYTVFSLSEKVGLFG